MRWWGLSRQSRVARDTIIADDNVITWLSSFRNGTDISLAFINADDDGVSVNVRPSFTATEAGLQLARTTQAGRSRHGRQCHFRVRATAQTMPAETGGLAQFTTDQINETLSGLAAWHHWRGGIV